MTSWLALSHMFEEQFNARLQSVKQDLHLQSIRLPRISSADYQIISFFNSLDSQGLSARSDEYVATVIDHIDSYYPDSFKWLFWNDEGKVRNINSDAKIYGADIWQDFIEFMLASLRITPTDEDYDASDQKLHHLISLNTIQRIIGSAFRAEYLAFAGAWPYSVRWFGKPVTFYFAMQSEEYGRNNIPQKISSGILLMVNNEALGEGFWLKRVITRRRSSENRLAFPLVALSTSGLEVVAISPELQLPGFYDNLLRAYYERKHDEFEFGNYIARLSRSQVETASIMISLVDISELKSEFLTMTSRLNAICLLLLLFYFIGYMWQSRTMSMSLQLKIALLFALATLLPVVSLVSLGNIYVDHEYNRLIEAAYVNMRSGMESMELRYKDMPRLIEEELYKDLEIVVGTEFENIDSLADNAHEAVKRDLIENYLLMDADGQQKASNWTAADQVIKRIISASIRQGMKGLVEKPSDKSSLLRDAIDEEMSAVISSSVIFDLSGGNKLITLVYNSKTMYFISLPVKVADEDMLLFSRVPEYLLEEKFARIEYAQNRMATADFSQRQNQSVSELIFFSRYMSVESLPPQTEVFSQLENEFFRAYNLKVEESGQLEVSGETFLFLIRPLSAMMAKSFIPCLLTSTNQIHRELGKVRLIVVVLALLAGLGALVLSLILSSNLLKPITLIDSAAVRLSNGDLSVQLPDLGADEIGNLSRNFNEMVKGLQRHERMKAYVSDSVVKAVESESSAQDVQSKTTEATVLFSDVRNFTGLSEKYGAKAIFAFLNSLMSGLENAIRSNDGRVDKFIGDAVMAVFSQDSDCHHAFAAVKAAVDMQSFVARLNEERSSQGLFTAQIGIGISSGNVLQGEVGSHKRKDLTIIGDEVSLAARLESASKKGKHTRIMISAGVMKNIAHLIKVEKMPFTEAKSKKQDIEIFELVRLNNSES